MENEEIRSTLTFTYPDGTPFPSVITAANTTYIPSGGWYGVIPPTPLAPMPIPFNTGQIYIGISDADVERIADAVIKKLATWKENTL